MSEFYGARDDAESIATIHRALDLGCTFPTPSDIYGPFTNEELVGRAIAGRRDQVFLATKFGIVRDPNDKMVRAIDGKPDYVKHACDASLKRLGVDAIDIYYQHCVDPATPIEDTVGAMADLVRAGKVRHLRALGGRAARRCAARRGSTRSAAIAVGVLSAVEPRMPRTTCQDPPRARHPFGRLQPAGRGFLTGEVRSFDDFPADDYRRMSPRFQGENFAKNP